MNLSKKPLLIWSFLCAVLALTCILASPTVVRADPSDPVPTPTYPPGVTQGTTIDNSTDDSVITITGTVTATNTVTGNTTTKSFSYTAGPGASATPGTEVDTCPSTCTTQIDAMKADMIAYAEGLGTLAGTPTPAVDGGVTYFDTRTYSMKSDTSDPTKTVYYMQIDGSYGARGIYTVTLNVNYAAYDITSGDNQSHTVESGSSITITCNGAYADFTGLTLDGAAVSTDGYTAESGSTIVTLNADYLSSLSLGSHTLVFNYTGGITAIAHFSIAAKPAAPAPTPEPTPEPEPEPVPVPTATPAPVEHVKDEVPQTGDAALPMGVLPVILPILAVGLGAALLIRRKANR